MRDAEYSDIKYVDVPYLGMADDGTVTRNWANMTFRAKTGKVDRRLIKRQVRRWVKQNLGRTLHTTELRKIMQNCVSNGSEAH